ncbi:MAG: metal ABC transporter permease, partial [Candidatus Bathyarchaeota archaeon]|nr:metal ABC transporter permease [Candidatus Termiticorpusculum sp.]
FNYLFGSILTITLSDLLLVSALSTFVLLFIGFFRRELLSMIFDEEDSKLRGIPTNYLTIIFDILTAITIVLSIKIIGTILVIAILVIPGLCALKLNLSFKKTLLTTTLFSTISTTTGIIISAIFNIATAGIIVLVLVTFFIITLIYKKLE